MAERPRQAGGPFPAARASARTLARRAGISGASAGRRDRARDQGAGGRGARHLTDGEIRRESYSNRFATALEGVDIDNPGTALDRSGHPNPVPRIVGEIRRKHAIEVEDLLFLKRHTRRAVKITLPGPFTMSQQAQNDFYPSAEAAAMDYAAAVNAEIKDLFAAGADVVQIDEPYMQARPGKPRNMD